jgi:uncharacterized protein YbjT (DUF2867 family)
MITVMGATGHVGRQIAQRLLATGEPVRVIGRNQAALAELADAGAQVAAGDAADAEFLAEAFRGSDAVHTLLPYPQWAPDFRAEQARLGEAILAAVRASGVPRVVALSSLGADLPSGTGFIAAGLHPAGRRRRGGRRAARPRLERRPGTRASRPARPHIRRSHAHPRHRDRTA